MLTCRSANIRGKVLDLLKRGIESARKNSYTPPMYTMPKRWDPQQGLYNGQTYLERSLGIVNSGKTAKPIFFYEFSDTTRCPLSFRTLDELMVFLNTSHIKVYPHDLIRMEAMTSIYGICRFGTTEFVYAQTKERMMEELKDGLPF